MPAYAGELGPHLGGIGMAQVIQDDQSKLPGLLGLRQLAGVVVGVAGGGESRRFGWAVAEFPGGAERRLVADAGLGKVAEMMLGVAEAVPDVSFENAVTDLSVE